MATYKTRTIPVVDDGDGTGADLDIEGWDGKYVELSGTFDATIGFEVSFDGGTTWREIQSLTTANGFFLDEPATHIHAVTSSYVSGTPAALIRGSQ